MQHKFQQKDSAIPRRVILVLLLVVAIVCIAVYAKEGAGGFLHSTQSAVSGTASIAGSAGSFAESGVDALARGLSNATADQNSLSDLRKQNEELRSMVAQAEEYRKEAERLQGLLKLKDSYKAKGVGARVIGKSVESWNQTVTIDKGSADGVETGLTVMGSTGVVGQVVSVSEHAATVRLLTDPQSGCAAVIQSSRAEGIVRGSLEGLLYLENVDVDVKVESGDVVLTSGLGGSYTPGLMVGMVVKVDNNQGDASRRIVVAPNDPEASIEEVYVVFSADSNLANAGDASANSDSGSSDKTSSDSGSSSDSSADASSSDASGDSSSADGSADGSEDASSDGSTDSTGDGSADGSADGSYDAAADGSADGSYDASADGSYDASADGSYDASADYAADGTDQGGE